MWLARTATVAPLLSVMLFACGGGKEKKPPLDLVGEPSREIAGEVETTAEGGGSADDLFVIDLTQDHLFRLGRDGWDLHSPASHIGIDKLKEGGVDLVLTAVPPPTGSRPSEELERDLARLEKLVADCGDDAALVSGLGEARRAAAEGKVAFAALLEGADALVGKEPEYLLDLKRRGVMAIGLIGPRGNSFGGAAAATDHEGGLTEEGARLVSSCRDLGILVDLTHASQETFWDVLVREGSLVAVTHVAARSLRDHPRNLTDLQILALSRSGGVMGLNFNPDLLVAGQGDADTASVIEHVSHVARLGALDALALGTDYGGIRPPRGLPDASAIATFRDALRAAGFDEGQVGGILSKNAGRLLESVEAKQGAAEDGRGEPLRPIPVECETTIGESRGVAQRSCDGRLTGAGFVLHAASRQRLRLQDMRHEPVRIEIFGEPGTPWQVEAQNLEGKVLMRRGVALDATGHGTLPLPSGRNLTRVFVSPTRESTLREAVLWGR
jgi:membrane dipeptidase